MHFDIITIFPEIIEAYLGESIMKRAREKGLVQFSVHDLRAYSQDKHKKVDDRPFGGGPGMVLQIEPIVRALHDILRATKGSREAQTKFEKGSRQARTIKIILFSAAGKKFDAKMAANFAKRYNRIVMIAGRYEGVDERLAKVLLQTTHYPLQTISIGDYVLTGGELPALIVADAVSRHIPGVLGKGESLEENRHGVGVPVYTRPEVFEWPTSGRGKKKKKYRVPKKLLSGDHKKIDEWRKLQRRDSMLH